MRLDDKKELLSYRLNQAEETLVDAQSMLQSAVSPRSIINRAYYVVFYSILALFIGFDISIKTSKHSGVISIFDKEFIHTGRLNRVFSRTAHRLFQVRQEADYKEFLIVTSEDAVAAIGQARDFYAAANALIQAFLKVKP